MPDQGAEERDAELIRRSAAGDDEAFAGVVAGHEGAVFRFIRAMAADAGAAEDALQETFLSAWRGAGSFRGESSVRTWLLTIARNAVVRQRRRRVDEPRDLEPLSELGIAAGWGDPGPEQVALQRESQAVVWQALRGLSDDDREILVLRDVEGVSGPDGAEMLGLSIPAMKTRLHRARLRLAAKVRETYARA